MYCTNCNNTIKYTDKYCTNCGKVNNIETEKKKSIDIIRILKNFIYLLPIFTFMVFSFISSLSMNFKRSFSSGELSGANIFLYIPIGIVFCFVECIFYVSPLLVPMILSFFNKKNNYYLQIIELICLIIFPFGFDFIYIFYSNTVYPVGPEDLLYYSFYLVLLIQIINLFLCFIQIIIMIISEKKNKDRCKMCNNVFRNNEKNCTKCGTKNTLDNKNNNLFSFTYIIKNIVYLLSYFLFTCSIMLYNLLFSYQSTMNSATYINEKPIEYIVYLILISLLALFPVHIPTILSLINIRNNIIIIIVENFLLVIGFILWGFVFFIFLSGIDKTIYLFLLILIMPVLIAALSIIQLINSIKNNKKESV